MNEQDFKKMINEIFNVGRLTEDERDAIFDYVDCLNDEVESELNSVCKYSTLT